MKGIVFRYSGNRDAYPLLTVDHNADSVTHLELECISKLFGYYCACLTEVVRCFSASVAKVDVIIELCGIFGNKQIGFHKLIGFVACGIINGHIAEH